MSAWLSRNAKPIAVVLVASAVVIGVLELLAALAGSDPRTTTAGAGEDLEGAAALAGLIKVVAFLTVSGAITLIVRRRLGRERTV